MEIINYDNKYQADFKRLNMEWLERYNLTESHDLEILDDPEGTVIKNGGCVFLAKENDDVIATAGLWKESDEEYELIKMTVDPLHRGKGISKLLLDRCLQEASDLHAKKIILYSNSQLKTALKLYEGYGFRYVDVTNAPFLTADVKMELDLEKQ
jgi:putative acetyltransferase